jgi:hypothetical protein
MLRGQDAQARMDPYLAESQLSVTSTVVRASLPESFRVSFPDSFRAPVRLCVLKEGVSIAGIIVAQTIRRILSTFEQELQSHKARN